MFFDATPFCSVIEDEFCPDANGTTSNATYVKVPLPTLRSLPKLKVSDKRKIIPGASVVHEDLVPKAWAEATGQPDAVPLFWSESKGVAFWKAFMSNHLVENVVDLSTSWALATACLEMNKTYLGIASCKEHAAFVSNVIDLQALRVCTDTDHALWQQSLETLIKKHFQEILDASVDSAASDDYDLGLDNED